ncbi:tripartite tricarboxylate transporter TctB family protein [Phreatobacter sp. AB_2022a]|uniref:tripartite tricarboxylate transporter TctB family protein n=1 Tax=Phreatobacter sp. AB_2022a TaxID=3003134 RepID=UPI002286D5C1|nr:tripartite tricarboxylate transporter TctB family protein [Phreatobacter sp. AB_2022a]MCZ0737049.1 tripartite tricarboxylate transporter TctB family protein [Phreatobacter sp. AB_2022a]
MHLSDRVTGGFFAALGAAAAYGGSLLPPVPGQQVGPNVFPMVIGFGLIACGLAIAFGVGRSFEEPEEIVTSEDGSHAPADALPPPVRHGALKTLVPPLLLLFYAFSVDMLGFIPTAAIMVLATSLALGGTWRTAVPLALVAPPAVHLIFAKLLRVPLPAGLLPMPW